MRPCHEKIYVTSDDDMGRKKLYADAAARKRAQRAEAESAARSHQLDARPPVVAVVDHADPVGALAEWSRKTLIVPPGHHRAGEPMALPEFAVDWLRASWDAHESALSTARKNAKSQRLRRCWRSVIWLARYGVLAGVARSRLSINKKRPSCGGKSRKRLRRRPKLDVKNSAQSISRHHRISATGSHSTR